MRRAALGCLLVALTACAGRTTPPPPPPELPPATPLAAPSPEPPVPVETPVPRPMAVLNGTVTYRQRIALTPEAEVHVELREVSAPGAEPILVAKKVVTRPGQVPIAFALEYDPSEIVSGRAYAVSARIADRGQLAFVTETPVSVLSGGQQAAVEIVVGPVR